MKKKFAEDISWKDTLLAASSSSSVGCRAGDYELPPATTVLCAGRLMEVKTHINNILATAKRWPRPLHRGGRWIEVSNTAVYWQINRDFGKWPLNGGWPVNWWPLNGGRTVYVPPLIFQILDFIYWTVLIFILIYFEWCDTENQQYIATLRNVIFFTWTKKKEQYLCFYTDSADSLWPGAPALA